MNASTSGAAARIRPATPSPYATGITPWALSQPWLASPARPITVAPARLASCTVIEPTPPAAPETTSVSPGRSATARTAAQAVNPATGSAPATSQGTFAGFGVRLAASTTAYSAWLDRVSTQPITSSPSATPVTPGPSRSTVPARSLPCPDGNVAGHRSCSRPSRILASPGLMPAALTRTSTCPAPGSGTGTSATSSTSSVPYSPNRTALIAASGRRYASLCHQHVVQRSAQPRRPAGYAGAGGRGGLRGGQRGALSAGHGSPGAGHGSPGAGHGARVRAIIARVEITGPRWSSDVHQADWIAPRLGPWEGEHVITIVVPAGFEAYARVLHPVEAPDGGDGDRLVRWADVAAWSGLPLRDDAQFHSVALPPAAPGEPPPFSGQGPREGSLCVPDAEVLAAITRAWTSTPEDCWFCVWDGFGWDSRIVSAAFAGTGESSEVTGEASRDPVPAAVRDGPRVRLPHREYLLYQGPAEAVTATAGLP